MYSVRNFYVEIPYFVFTNFEQELFNFFPPNNLIHLEKTNDFLGLGFQMEWTQWKNSLFNFFSSYLPKSDYQIKTAYAPLRKKSNHTSEMVSQALLGEMFTVFFEYENFMIGFTEDGYFGYISSHQLQPFKENLYRSFEGNEKIPIGSKILKEKPNTVNIDKLISYLINTPYLWGGRSNWGIDCSGLTQLIFLSQNITLPRDAYQQADFGTEISFGKHQKGDLAFFGKSKNQITHVGYILNHNTILHAYGLVRYDIFQYNGIFHTDYQKITHDLVCIKRYPANFNFLQFL